MKKSVRIDIFDQTYHVSGGLDRAYVEMLAEYVDRKMREVARSANTVDTARVAVLTALAIADELHALRQNRDENREMLRERAERCLKMVERALQQSA